MGIRIVRKPIANYVVSAGANYYAESDINLTTVLGTTERNYSAMLVNLVYGKIFIDNVAYLVSTNDMQMVDNVANYSSVQNTDDIIALRYAFNDQNGYVPNIGSELSANYESGTFTLNSGHVVVQGSQYNIDANGISTTLDTSIGIRYFKIYLKVNLIDGTAELLNYYSTVSYDNIPDPESDELIKGNTAYLLVYTIKLNGATQMEISKIVRQIEYNSSRRLLWTGNAEIGTTNPESSLLAFATIPAKENTMYEVHGEITYNSPNYTKETFVIYLQVGEYNQYGYMTEQIVGTWMTSDLLQFKKIQIERGGDFFFGRALMPTLYFSTHNISYNTITASVTKIYEVE